MTWSNRLAHWTPQNNMNVHIVIPARYNSSRLPGKPLLEIKGRPVVWHVFQRALETNIESVIVATDDDRIYRTVESFGCRVLMTNEAHESGTDRLAEVAIKLGFDDNDIVVNLQGDEPLIDPNYIEKVVAQLKQNHWADISTLMCTINSAKDLFNPNIVKVVTAHDSSALYFSRAPIPWERGKFDKVDSLANLSINDGVYHRHIGLYAYRVSTLKSLSQSPVSTLEQIEALEQLRALHLGKKIAVAKVDDACPHGVDTIEDYERIKSIME